MQRVDVKVSSVGDNQSPVSFRIEQKSGPDPSSWSTVEVNDAQTGDPSAERSFSLQPDQRLVIVGLQHVEELVYDPAQAAAIRPSQQQNSNIAADAASPSLTEAEQKKIDAAAHRAVLDATMNDPIRAEKAGLTGDKAPSRTDVANSSEVKRELAEIKKREEKEKADANRANQPPANPGASTASTTSSGVAAGAPKAAVQSAAQTAESNKANVGADASGTMDSRGVNVRPAAGTGGQGTPPNPTQVAKDGENK